MKLKTMLNIDWDFSEEQKQEIEEKAINKIANKRTIFNILPLICETIVLIVWGIIYLLIQLNTYIFCGGAVIIVIFYFLIWKMIDKKLDKSEELQYWRNVAKFQEFKIEKLEKELADKSEEIKK